MGRGIRHVCVLRGRPWLGAQVVKRVRDQRGEGPA